MPQAVIRANNRGRIEDADLGELDGVVTVDPDEATWGNWACNRICERRQLNSPNSGARLLNWTTNMKPSPLSYGLAQVVIPQTNKNLHKSIDL